MYTQNTKWECKGGNLMLFYVNKYTMFTGLLHDCLVRFCSVFAHILSLSDKYLKVSKHRTEEIV